MNKASDDKSWDLNPIGMQLLFENINLYELRLSNMEMLEDGTVKETYQSGPKNYSTDGKTCTCSYFAQYMFCRHLILFRLERYLPVYDSLAIHPSLLKTDERINIRKTNPDAEPEPPIPVSRGTCFTENVPSRARPQPVCLILLMNWTWWLRNLTQLQAAH